MKIPFFGNDDDEDPPTQEEIGDFTVVSNRKNVAVKTISGDDLSPGETSKIGGLRVHKIDLSESSGGSQPADQGTTTPTPEQPTTPDISPSPETHSRGTFVIPDDKRFLQMMEARGKNGHGKIVETIYVLTGPTYTQPTDLICLGNPEFYGSTTRTSVKFNPKLMAEKVASIFPEPPKLVARFHTHPSGSLKRSSADKQSAPKVRQSFVNAFGTDDFEFFHGIHGLQDHRQSTTPDERHHPTVQRDHLSWIGDRFEHKIGVFGRRFESPKDIAIGRTD
jgi:hypothetical protein